MQGHDDDKHGIDLLHRACILSPLSCYNGGDVQDNPHPVSIFFLPDPTFPRDSLNLCISQPEIRATKQPSCS